MARKSKSSKREKVLRSKERFLFAYHVKDSPSGVKRETIKRFADQLNLNETRFLHLAAARLVHELNYRAQKADEDYAPVTDKQLAALRRRFPQNHEMASSVLDFLNED
jgi:hypothetical protein